MAKSKTTTANAGVRTRGENVVVLKVGSCAAAFPLFFSTEDSSLICVI